MRETNSTEDEGQCDDVPRCEGAEATGVGGEDRKGGEPYQHGFEDADNYIENVQAGERLQTRVEGGTNVFDVHLKNGSSGTITLDSAAGVNVWREGLLTDVPILDREPGLRMTAANGTESHNMGSEVIEFVGQQPDFTRRE